MKVTFPNREAGLALGAYVLLLVLPPLMALSLFEDFLTSRASLAERQQQIERLEAGRRSPVETIAVLPAGQALFDAETATLSVSEMQKRITALLISHGAAVLASQAQTTPEGSLRRLQVSVDLVVPESALAGLLHGLEVDRPFLFIDALAIQMREDAGNSDRLRMNLRLQGFSRGAS
jgi:hypothetical protein